LITVAAPVVLSRSIQVIEQYLREDGENPPESGPVAQSSFLQLRCVLRESTALETHLPNSVHPAIAACPFENSTHKHAIVLYPLLCDLTTVKDPAVKPEIKALLKLVGKLFFTCSAPSSETTPSEATIPPETTVAEVAAAEVDTASQQTTEETEASESQP